MEWGGVCVNSLKQKIIQNYVKTPHEIQTGNR